MVPHSRKLTISGRTEADKHVNLTARTGGVLTELRVKRGMWVKEGDIIAVPPTMPGRPWWRRRIAGDPAPHRARGQTQADRQRRPPAARSRQYGSHAQGRGGALAARRPSAIAASSAPWSGSSTKSWSRSARPRSLWRSRDREDRRARSHARRGRGRRAQARRRQVGDYAKVRLVTGEIASGRIRFVAKTASQSTRTYRVEVELPNADGAIPDGITAEVSVQLAQVAATRVPRSA